MAPLSLLSSSREVVDGWVSDSACGALHTKPGGERCIKLCIRGGGSAHPEWKPQKVVLVADSGGKIWTVKNPYSLVGCEGKHVRVSAKRGRTGLFVYSAAVTEENYREP